MGNERFAALAGACRQRAGLALRSSEVGSSLVRTLRMPSETTRHLELKRDALAWAQHHGYRIAAAEVSVPACQMRFDVAAYRPARARRKDRSPAVTAIFECKQCRPDFVKDSRCANALASRLAKLHERRALYEESMRLHQPSLRNADTLFPEFDSYRFESAGYEPYDRLLREMHRLTARLHGQTKFHQLLRRRAANLHYLVMEEGVAQVHEVPPGWGLLVRIEGELRLQCEPTWHETSEEVRTALLLRIAMAGTRAVNQRHGVQFPFRTEEKDLPTGR